MLQISPDEDTDKSSDKDEQHATCIQENRVLEKIKLSGKKFLHIFNGVHVVYHGSPGA